MTLLDYCPHSKTNKVKTKAVKPSKKTFALNQRVVFIVGLVALVILLSFVAIKLQLENLYQLKENERVLLLQNKKPIAILYFNVNNKQLVVSDLRRENFDLSSLDSATISSQLKRNLIYSFILGTAFDQSYEYSSNNLDRDSLTIFFKKQKIYYSFLKDKDLLWKEQTYAKDNSLIMEPIFNCPIALINTTGEAGLASSLANIFEKSAFSIIKKDDNKQNLSQSKITYDPDQPACQQIIEKLNKILPESSLVADKNDVAENRASLVIYIGRDLADLYLFFVNLFHGQI